MGEDESGKNGVPGHKPRMQSGPLLGPVSRRGVLGGITAGSVAAYATAASANRTYIRRDLRLQLSADGAQVRVIEMAVYADGVGTVGPPSKTWEEPFDAAWSIDAARFGPYAFFDMLRPQNGVRQIVIRKGHLGKLHQIQTLVLSFTQATGNPLAPWQFNFKTDIWNGKSKSIAVSRSVELSRFIQSLATPSIESSSDEIGDTISTIFDGLVATSKIKGAQYAVSLDVSLCWKIRGREKALLFAHDDQVSFPNLTLGWRKALREDPTSSMPPADQPTTLKTASANWLFEASNDRSSLLKPNAGLIIGPVQGHHAVLTPADGTTLHTRIDVFPTPLRKVKAKELTRDDMQCVVVLRTDSGLLRSMLGSRTLVGDLTCSNLSISQTKLSLHSVVRSAIWGHAAKADPQWIDTPIGSLSLGARPVAQKGESKNKPTKDIGTTPAGAEGQKADDDNERLKRLLSAASGDRTGLGDASLYAVADRSANANAPLKLRRLHADVLLHAADLALPDSSWSSLTFRRSELRLAFEDGLPLVELPSGEQPRPLAPSFVWAGPDPKHKSDFLRGGIDLRGAELACARDHDLMKLRMRFDALRLEFRQKPVIVPSRGDHTVYIGKDGEITDNRPRLVVEFDPQHLLEEAIFRAEPLPPPDVTEPLPQQNTPAEKWKPWDRAEFELKLSQLASESERVKLRIKAQNDKQTPVNTDSLLLTNQRDVFKKFAEKFKEAATELPNLPKDQQIYVGPYALDPDAMALARRLRRDDAVALTTDLLEQVEKDATGAYKTKFIAHHRGISSDILWQNARKNEATMEQAHANYGVFRQFWRDLMVRFVSQRRRGWSVDDIVGRLNKEYEFKKADKFKPEINPEVFRNPDPFLKPLLSEYLFKSNRFDGYPDIKELEAAVVQIFVAAALDDKPVKELMRARLSGRSRLVFRLNGEPSGVGTAYESGVNTTPINGPANPGAGNATFPPIPFTFQALTDWSRHELAVTRRAQKLFHAHPSGRLLPIGFGASNPSDYDQLRYQGFTAGYVTGEQRMAEVRASLKSARIAREDDDARNYSEAKKVTSSPHVTDDDKAQKTSANGADRKTENEKPGPATTTKLPNDPFPGEPLDYETSIELPSRLFLSPAQDAVWRTPRALPDDVFSEFDDARVAANMDARPTQLWSVRLDTHDNPSLRAVGSPDLRISALITGRPAGQPRLPGQGAPPRGPLAPWFIGPEQMESESLTPEDVYNKLPENDKKQLGEKSPNEICPLPSVVAEKGGLLNWLCTRLGLIEKLKAFDNLAEFRTSLDAFDRHQLVLLTSAYGLPVIGKRDAIKTNEGTKSGVLISDSGQIEPGEDFRLIDSYADQAIQKPLPLKVTELTLSALGGSLVHDTKFNTSAGANDVFGRKIFEGFAIEALQQEIVLGRDVRTEVVYKGYLLPIGHKASFVKLTERVFLRTKTNGIKAMLRQRMFLRIADRDKDYDAIEQPFFARMWCAKNVKIQIAQTPDILDPTRDQVSGDNETPFGRISLGKDGAGLAFWPRTDHGENGIFKFPVTLDGTPVQMPLLFVDNIAATASADAAVRHYNLPSNLPRRQLNINGQKIDFASNCKQGEAQFATETLVVMAQGRFNGEDAAGSWTGALDNYNSEGFMEGAGQPPFYPALDYATIRHSAIERMTGGARQQIDVQYDGHYIRYGFTDDPEHPQRKRKDLKPADANARNIFLTLRKPLPLTMGSSGDRSGGIARPDSEIIAISRDKGPMGGAHGEAIWQYGPGQPTGKYIPQDSNEPRVFPSAAMYFNIVTTEQQQVAGSAAPPPNPSAATAPAVVQPENGEKDDSVVKQLQAFFTGDAKLLGVITFKDLIRLLEVTTDSIPELKETLDYAAEAGKQAKGAVDSTLGDAAQAVRTRLLLPLRDIVRSFRREWNDFDRKFQQQQGSWKADKVVPLISLAELYPELGSGLTNLETRLDRALETQDAIALGLMMNDLKRAADELIRAIRIIANEAANRLAAAVTEQLQTSAAGLEKAISTQLKLALPIPTDAGGIANLIAMHLIPELTPPDTDIAWELLQRIVPDGLLPPDIQAVARQIGISANAALESAFDEARKGLPTATRSNLSTLIKAAIEKQSLPSDALDEFMNAQRKLLEEIAGNLKTRISVIGALTDKQKTALNAAVDAHSRRTLAKAAAANRVDIARLDRWIALARNGHTVAKEAVEAVKSSDPRRVLNASGALAKVLFGERALASVDVYSKKLDELEQAAVSSLDKAFGKTGSALAAPTKLSAELQAVEQYRPPHSKDDAIPVLSNGSADGSNELIKDLAIAIQAVTAALAALDKTKLPDPQDLDKAWKKIPEPRPAHLAPDALLKFWNDLKLPKDPSLPKGHPRLDDDGLLLTAEKCLKNIYADAVEICVLATIIPPPNASIFASQRLDQLPRRLELAARALDALTASIVLELRTLSRVATNFYRQHEKIITTGLLASPLVALAKEVDEPALKPFEAGLQKAESAAVDVVKKVLDAALRLLRGTAVAAHDTAKIVANAIDSIDADTADYGHPLRPQIKDLQDQINQLSTTFESYKDAQIENPGTTFGSLLKAKIKGTEGKQVEAFFKAPTSTTDSEFSQVAKAVRNLETAAIAKFDELMQRFAGAPETIRHAAENWALTNARKPVADFYSQFAAARKNAEDAFDKLPSELGVKPGQALRVAVDPRLGPCTASNCDRLVQEIELLEFMKDAKKPLGEKDIQRLAIFIGSWQSGQAAPIAILDNALKLVRSLLRGEILAVIDLAAFRDRIEDVIAGLVPVRQRLAYDFKAPIRTRSAPDAIFRPEKGAKFGIEVRANIDLLSGASDYLARAHLGPFEINLLGSAIKAVKLKFGGASFVARSNASPKLDVIYQDFEIGEDLKWAKDLQSFLTPKDGNGPYVEPLRRTPGIEAGYRLDLGVINVGPVIFSNVSLNVGAEIPFDGTDARFRVSLGRRLSPFMISVPPYAGSAYFALIATADRIRGFEASFEFGGGGAFAFGPLTGEGRLQVGVFISTMEYNRGGKVVRITEIYGTFFVGGSADIWIFHFEASLYVRMSAGGDGGMYGEAVFTFSFSLGIADYDYSVTAMHGEEPIGSSGQASLDSGQTRFAEDTQIIRQGMMIPTAAPLGPSNARSQKRKAPAPSPTTPAPAATATTKAPPEGTHRKVRGPMEDWSTYLDYFDLGLKPDPKVPL